MTKANEIAILRQAIEQLGPNTYCGPWLASVVDEVEATIRSDFFPTNTVAESEEKARLVLEGATASAAEIIAKANAQAIVINQRAEKHRDSVIESMRNAIRYLNDV